MTPSDLAGLLHARRVGHGRWSARCPAHADSSPSLSVREGHGGRILLHCFAGCATEVVLEAAGLRMGDLFAGSPPTPEQAREAAQERTRSDAEALQARREHRRLTDRYRKLQAVWEAIAARLVGMPDGAKTYAMAKLFHEVQERLREIEAVFEAEEQRAFHERLMRLERRSEQLREAA